MEAITDIIQHQKGRKMSPSKRLDKLSKYGNLTPPNQSSLHLEGAAS
jgi:hypothetical protein